MRGLIAILGAASPGWAAVIVALVTVMVFIQLLLVRAGGEPEPLPFQETRFAVGEVEFEVSSPRPVTTWGVQGFSMVPTVFPGQTVITMPVGAAEVQRFDVILFAQEDIVVGHRVVAVGEDEEGWYAITRGDSQPIDPWVVREGALLGRVFLIVSPPGLSLMEKEE